MRAFVLCLALAYLSASAFAQGGEPARDSILEYWERYGVPQVPPPDLVPVEEALRDHRFEDAIQVCNELIARDERRFRSKPEASWIKSEAYRYRADATFRLTGDRREAIQLLKPAADAGNLMAATAITESMWRKFEGDPEYASVEASPDELGKYLRIGAALGDPLSATMLGAENSQVPINKREKIYWSLVGFALAINDDVKFRQRWMRNVISRVGELEVSAAITEHSLLPPRTPAGPGQLPGRGLLATIYADATLRRDYGYSYGRRMPEGTQTGPTASTLEVFKALQAYANMAGDISAFLLVPGTRRFEDRSLISVQKADMLPLLGPSDYVFVRCGPLTHVAVVHHVDRDADRVYIVDGLWQFWQPSHNSCITYFDLVPLQHAGFLAEISLSDLSGILEAIATLRDRPPENVSQEKRETIPDDFRKLLGEAAMVFEQPQEYSPVPIRENKDMSYHYAIKSDIADLEVRYHILPMPDDPKTKYFLNSEQAHYSMTAATVANISKGGAVLSGAQLTEDARFGADVGSIIVSEVQHSEFGKGYQLCMTISLFARNKGHAYIFFLFNADNAKEAQDIIGPAYHNLRFTRE
jgi:hypothetical protein